MAALLWFRSVAAAAPCSSSSSLVGFQADFDMVQHQLRGRLHIVDDCSFTVSRSDVIKLLRRRFSFSGFNNLNILERF